MTQEVLVIIDLIEWNSVVKVMFKYIGSDMPKFEF